MSSRPLAHFALLVLSATPIAVAQEFPDGPTHPTCPDDFATGAAFRITDLVGNRLTVTLMTDLHTIVGRSDPFIESDPADLGAAICSAGAAPYLNTLAIVGDPARQPVGFPAGSPTRRQVHTEILSLNLTDGAVTIKAGQAYYNSVNPGGVPLPQSRFFRNSTGEVASLYNGNPVDKSKDFPAASYFNVFVEVSIPGMSLKLYNKTALVVSTTITEFPPKLNLPNSTYIHDPTFAVPLFDDRGLPFGWLLSAGHGSSVPSAIQLQPDAAFAMPCPVSFCLDQNSLGLDPLVTLVAPNQVFADGASTAKPLHVYRSSSNASPGSPPNMSNARSLTGPVGPLPAFAVGDMTNSLSFGRDGTRFDAPCCTVHSGALFFSVSRTTRGITNTDVNVNATLVVPEAAADVYMSSVGAFGRYADMATTGAPVNNHALATDSTELGLRPDIVALTQDNVTALELHVLLPNGVNRDFVYGTYRGPSFANSASTIFVYDPASGPYQPSNLVSFAGFATMGLVAADVIDALAVSDATTNSCPAFPNRVVNPGLDEVLLSLAPGSPSLLGPDGAPGLVNFNDDGINGIDDIGETGLGDDQSPATIFYSTFSGTKTVFALPQAFGLLNNDDIDAIDIKPGEFDTCHSPSTPFCVGDGTTGLQCPCGNNGSFGHGCANSVFTVGALLTSTGTTSVSADTLSLTCSTMTGPGLFIQANGIIGATPLGDGLLCAGSGLIRMGVVFPTANIASYPGGPTPLPISVAGSVNPGNTKHYQCWYRDNQPFCVTQTYNLSNGLTLVWSP